MTDFKLTLGPILFNWPADQWRDFYFRIADEANIDRVYVGETVCSKRSPFIEPYIPDVIERLASAGKEVVLSTLALVTTKRELKQIAENAADHTFLLEANDITALQYLKGKPHLIGPFVNTYNEGTLNYFAKNGAINICLPPELPKDSIETLANTNPDLETEVQVYGRIPLALSARCYHARVHHITKDSCKFICEQDPDGLDVDTLDGEPFMAINGIQTMSYRCLNLIQELPELKRIGINNFRLSPHTHDMIKTASIYREVLNGSISPDEGLQKLSSSKQPGPFANGFFHGIEGEKWIESHTQ